jgi:hypothetical protein
MGNKVVVVDGAYSDLPVMESILPSAGRDVVTDLEVAYVLVHPARFTLASAG